MSAAPAPARQKKNTKKIKSQTTEFGFFV